MRKPKEGRITKKKQQKEVEEKKKQMEIEKQKKFIKNWLLESKIHTENRVVESSRMKKQ